MGSVSPRGFPILVYDGKKWSESSVMADDDKVSEELLALSKALVEDCTEETGVPATLQERLLARGYLHLVSLLDTKNRQMVACGTIRTVEKPWGREDIWAYAEDKYAGKVLTMRAGTRTSKHYHVEKDETLMVWSGRVEVETFDESLSIMRLNLTPGRSWRVRAGDVHRIEALEDSVVFEVSTPELDDVVRVEDDYGRSRPRNTEEAGK